MALVARVRGRGVCVCVCWGVGVAGGLCQVERPPLFPLRDGRGGRVEHRARVWYGPIGRLGRGRGVRRHIAPCGADSHRRRRPDALVATASFCLVQVLLSKYPSMFYNNFQECLYILNGIPPSRGMPLRRSATLSRSCRGTSSPARFSHVPLRRPRTPPADPPRPSSSAHMLKCGDMYRRRSGRGTSSSGRRSAGF